jgi:PhoD-like phosphatase
MRGRAQDGLGVYGVKLFDFARPRGQQEVPEYEAGIDADLPMASSSWHRSNQTVAVFVLDVRTNKTPWKTGSEKYLPDYRGDFLGEQQWQWFEQSIRRSSASMNIVLSGVQFHAHRFPDGNIAESWAQYPRAQQRLYDVLLEDSLAAPILVSGDVHMTQLSRKDCAKKGDHAARRSLMEFTTRFVLVLWKLLRSDSTFMLTFTLPPPPFTI